MALTTDTVDVGTTLTVAGNTVADDSGNLEASNYLRVGSSTSAVAVGDLSAGDGTNDLFWDASANLLVIGSEAASATVRGANAVTATAAGGGLDVTTGAGGGTSGDSGDLTLDTGTVTSGTTGTITLAGVNASALTLGRSGLDVSVPGDLTITGDLTVNGATTTLDTTNLVVEDVLAIFAKNAATGDEAGIAFERGSTGDDSILLWNEASTRFELGLFDTTGGTSVPTGALAALADLRVDDLLLAGTSITSDAGLSITTTTTGALSLDSGSTGAVSLGTGASAKVISIGNSTGATSVSIDSGSGGITLMTASGGTITLLSDGIMSLDTGSGAIETDATSLTADGAFTLAATSAVLSLDGTAIETSAASITGDGALTVAATSAILSLDGTGLETSATTLTADAGLTISTTTTSDLTLDSGTTGAVNLGTGASAKTITIGNLTGATAIDVDAGTGGVSIAGTGNTAVMSVDLATGGTGAKTLTIGSTASTSSTTIQTGTGAMTFTAGGVFDVNATGAVSIDGTTIALTGTDAVSITSGTTDDDLTLATGNNGAGASGDILADVGTASTTAGVISLGLTNATAINLSRTGVTTTINGLLSVAEAATFTTAADFDAGITVASGQSITGDGALTVAATSDVLSLDGTGLETSATTLTADAGLSIVTTTTGVLSLDSGTTGAINLGTGASAKTITIGNVTGATAMVYNAGTGGHAFTGDTGFFGATPVSQSAAYTRNATVVEDRTLLASASATVTNNNNVLAALIADLQAIGILG